MSFTLTLPCEVWILRDQQNKQQWDLLFLCSYMLPVGSPKGYCMIEVAADGNPSVQHRLSFSHRVSQVSLQDIKKELLALNISSAYALQLFLRENRYTLTSKGRNVIPLQISLYVLSIFLIVFFTLSNHNIPINFLIYLTLNLLLLLHKVHKKDMDAMRVLKKGISGTIYLRPRGY